MAGPDPVLTDFLEYLEFERALSRHTVAAYRRDLDGYASFLAQRGIGDPDGVSRDFLAKDRVGVEHRGDLAPLGNLHAIEPRAHT